LGEGEPGSLRGTAAQPGERPAKDGRAGRSEASYGSPWTATTTYMDNAMNTQPHDHIVRSFDEELQRLLQELLRMGDMAASQLEAALDVIVRRDDRAAERIVENDEAIDALEHEVSHDVMRLALRGPLARDLREILAALRIASDIERIGDYAANLAKRSRALNLVPPVPQTRGLDALGRLAVQQVRDVLAAYRTRDAVAAQKVRARDAELDTLHTSLFRELLTYMMEDARAITPCTHLLFMAKNLERIGDHATNIAENVWFLVHGEELMPPREKRDEAGLPPSS
jgi:phosphate transport system protein